MRHQRDLTGLVLLFATGAVLLALSSLPAWGVTEVIAFCAGWAFSGAVALWLWR